MSEIIRKLWEAIKDFWREVGPFFRHGVSISCVILIAAGIIKLLALLLPPEPARELDEIDLYLVKALFCLFGGYTFLIIGNRLLHFLWKEVAITWRKQPQAQQESLNAGAPKALSEASGSAVPAPEDLLAEIRVLRNDIAHLQVEVRNRK